MKKKVKQELIPYIVLAFDKLNISDYKIINENGTKYVETFASERLLKKAKRLAWTYKRTDETGVRHLCREQVNDPTSGVIPKEEKFWFDKAKML